jgi:hypothetical protein
MAGGWPPRSRASVGGGVLEHRREDGEELLDAFGLAREVDDQRAPAMPATPRLSIPIGVCLRLTSAHRLGDPGRLARDHRPASPRALMSSWVRPVPPVVKTKLTPSST